MNTQLFIEKAKEMHGDKYDYSKVEYINAKTNVIIICKEHGECMQTPNNHLTGYGCKKCGRVNTSNKQRGNTEEFIRKAIEIHGNLFDYSKVEYGENINTKVIIICNIHGEFQQSPLNHLQGNGCRTCGIITTAYKQRGNTKEFIERAIEKHGYKYDYSKCNYISIDDKLTIICKKHGEFNQVAYSHIIGQGCPICVNKTEAKLYEQLKTIYPSLLTQFKQEWCKKLKHLLFDFCIPEYKIIIELDGRQHFQQVRNWSSPEEQFENDKYKEECANENGYSVIRLLQEDVFNDTFDWVKELYDAIEEIKTTEGITNMYLCKNNEYNQF